MINKNDTREAANLLLAENHLSHFFKQSWSILEPATELKWGWHLDAICEHLEAVHKGEIKNLIINIPPRHSKSLLVSVAWPAWVWIQEPSLKWLFFSYAKDLSIRDSIKCRRLVQSDWYQDRWGDKFKITSDQNTKGKFENNEMGYRLCSSVGGVSTGEGADILACDDPHNIHDVESDVVRNDTLLWWDEVIPTRVNDPKKSAKVIIMQRSHEDDLTGHILAKEGVDYVHLCLPARYEPDNLQTKTPLEFKDPRTKFGEPLCPDRYGEKELNDLELELGEYATAGQLQQRPHPRGGGMFKTDKFQFVDLIDRNQIVASVRYWDKAGTKASEKNKNAKRTAGVLMHKMRDKSFVVEDVVKGKWDSSVRERIIRQTAILDGKKVNVWCEQEPGPIYEEKQILMENGKYEKLKNIRKNQYIIDGKGNKAKVLEVHKQGLLPCLKIKTKSGKSITGSLSHPVLTSNGYKNIDELNFDDNLSIISKRNNSIINKYSLEECRLAGYFVGDGCCTDIKAKSGKKSINAKIICSDPLETKDIEHCVNTMEFSIHFGGPDGHHFNLSNGIRPWLREVGLAGKRTENKIVPSWIFTSSNEHIANFIGAFFTCDGGASISQRGIFNIEFYNTSRQLLIEIQCLLLRLGIYSHFRRRSYSNEEFQSTRKTQYRLILHKSDGSMARFANQIPVYHDKKSKILNTLKQELLIENYISDKIVSIEDAGLLPCRCLTIEGDPSFICNDFVVHNSGGKESAEGTIRNLAGFICRADRVTGSKEVRADQYAAQVGIGNVYLLKAKWNRDFISEHESFPSGKYSDICDAASGSFNKLFKVLRAGTWGKR